MKLYDFERMFYDHCAAWLKAHPGVTEEQVDEQYNTLMAEWLEKPDAALGGSTPGAWFEAYKDPGTLLDMLAAYDRQGMTIPELLYARLVALGAPAVPALQERILDASASDAVRNTCFSILSDIDPAGGKAAALRIILDGDQPEDLKDQAARLLSDGDPETIEALLGAYGDAPDDTARLILDICSNSFDPRVTDLCLQRMFTHPEDRVYCASLLGRMCDERALQPLQKMLRLPELGYVEYREIANVIEMLGGDPDPARDFTGDADLEALQAAEVDWGLE